MPGMELITAATPSGLDALDPTEVVDRWEAIGLDRLSDDRLLDLAAEVVATPLDQPPSSFTLHAPLELLARRGLLGLVGPERRRAVRQRMAWVAATYREAGPVAAPVVGTPTVAGAADAASMLVSAADAGDVGGVDAAAGFLAAHGALDDLLGLGDVLVPRLAAAGHAPIALHLLARVAPRSRAVLGLVRPLVRVLADQPTWRVEWIDDRPWGPGPGSPDALERAVAEVPALGLPGSDFVYPLVHQVDAGGMAAGAVAPVLGEQIDVAAAGRGLLRVAARSMLHGDPAAAPYGWTHCLTLPQAAMTVARRSADPLPTLAVAATYVVAFRAAQGHGPLPGEAMADELPEPPGADPIEALDGGPPVAAAAAWHAPTGRIPSLVAELAARAGTHPDAHLAKYVMACLDAAADDPAAARLFLAAAASLVSRWGPVPADDPLRAAR